MNDIDNALATPMTETPRKRSTSSLADALKPLTSKAFRQYGFAQREVIARWPEIVGPVLADHCLPEKLSFRPGQKTDGTLHIRVGSGFALELQHLEPLVIEKINVFYGYKAVAKLVLRQAPLPSLQARRARKTYRLTDSQKDMLDKQLRDIKDTPLKQALAGLGTAVLAEEKTDKNKPLTGRFNKRGSAMTKK